MTETMIDTYAPLVDGIANEFARKFHRYGVERADVSQEMWLWLVKHPIKVAQWEEDDEGDASRPIAKTLRYEASRYCQTIKAQALGYSTDDLTFYGRKELQNTLLPAMFDEEAWTEPPVSEEGSRSQRDAATGGNWVAMLADVAQAFKKLELDDQWLLSAFHKEGRTNKLMAEMSAISEQAMSRKHQRAVGRLHKILGGDKPRNTHDDATGPCECEDTVGVRHVLTNAAARAVTQHQYDED